MSLKHLLSFFFCVSLVFSLELKDHYTISGLDFNASLIDPSIVKDFRIYRFEKNQHQKSFSSSTLRQKFEEQGIEFKDSSTKIIHVYRRSNFDDTPIRNKIRAYYHSYYPDMFIKEIYLEQNAFIEKLDNDYDINFKNNAYLYHRSSLYLSSAKTKKRYFINYQLKAFMKVFKASHNINRGKILLPIDFEYKEELFKRYKALPVLTITKEKIRAKKRLNTGRILYQNDIQRLPAVLKGNSLNVRLISGKLRLEFQATALEDGHVGDEVSIKKRNGTKLKAKVISTNLVEIQ